MVRRWIQKVVRKRGSLHRQLGIPQDKKIPVSLLKKIAKAKVGSKVRYGRKSYTVTGLLKKRVVLALTLRKLIKRKKKKKRR